MIPVEYNTVVPIVIPGDSNTSHDNIPCSSFCLETPDDLFEFKRKKTENSKNYFPRCASELGSEPFSADDSEYFPPNEERNIRSKSHSYQSFGIPTFFNDEPPKTCSAALHLLEMDNIMTTSIDVPNASQEVVIDVDGQEVPHNPVLPIINENLMPPSSQRKAKRNMPKKSNPGRKRSRNPENWAENKLEIKKKRW